MRSRQLAQLLVGTVLGAGLLAACAPPGGGDPEAVLVAFPPAAVFDLPDEESEEAHKTITITNIGSADSGPLKIDLVDDVEGFIINSPGGDCLDENLEPGDSCEFEVIVTGSVPDEDYEAEWIVFGDDSGSVTIPIFAI